MFCLEISKNYYMNLYLHFKGLHIIWKIISTSWYIPQHEKNMCIHIHIQIHIISSRTILISQSLEWFVSNLKDAAVSKENLPM